jgi:hypothetical protein
VEDHAAIKEAGMHFAHRFHPAGHGTFFTGHIGTPHRPFLFTWVYDCGSKEPTHLRGLIDDFYQELAMGSLTPRLIDLLCISHFDSDHVNGLDLFFKTFRVDTLILPYTHPHTRLSLACATAEDEVVDAAATAAMILDPIVWLELRGFGESIRKVILIQGRENNEPDGETADVPPPRDGDQLSEPAGDRSIVRMGYGDSELAGRTVLRDDSRSIGVDIAGNRIYEFAFYNQTPPLGAAPNSGASLMTVGQEAAKVVRDYDMARGKIARQGWRDALRALYEHHFGSTPKAKNSISLCVHGRPLITGPVEPCELHRQSLRAPLASLKPAREDKTGVLLTGDSTLKKRGLQALKQHLGEVRWNRIGAMQIPHHGSDHNWQSGNLELCGHCYSVICAPGSQHHPHKNVLRDVRNSVLSNYGIGVAYDYHTVDG